MKQSNVIKKYTPHQWAKAIAENIGWQEAYLVTLTTGRPLLGTDNSFPNPRANFYLEAKRWIKKHSPVDLTKPITQRKECT